MEEHASPPRPRLAAAIAAAFVVLLVGGIGVAHVLGTRRVEVGTDVRALLSDGRRIVVRRFRGPPHTPVGELQLRDAALAVVWSVPLEPASVGSLYPVEGGVLYRTGDTLVARELATGAIRWTAPMEHPWEYAPQLELHVLDRDVLEILQESYGHGTLVRRRSLATGALAWATEPLAIPPDARLRWWWYDGDLFFDAERTASRIDLATGAVEALAPADALATCYTTRESLYVDSAWHVWIRPYGGTARELGWLAPGRLECARAERRIWVEWGGPRVLRVEEPFEPRGALSPTTGLRAAEGADGAVFVLDDTGALVWGAESRWGAPRFGIERPSAASGAFVVPRAGAGQLILRLDEAEEGHDEIGFVGGRTAQVTVDEATGRVL